MRNRLFLIAGLLAASALARPADAQIVSLYSPTWASAPVVTSPVYAPPVAVRRPVIDPFYGGVSVYRPAVPVAAPVYAPAVPLAPAPVVVTPRYYVPGQPVRNVLRAVTP